MELRLVLTDEGPAEPLPIVEERRLALCQIFKKNAADREDAEHGLIRLIDAFLPKPYRRTCNMNVWFEDLTRAEVGGMTACRATDVDCMFLMEPMATDSWMIDSSGNAATTHVCFLTWNSVHIEHLSVYIENGLVSREDGPAIVFTSKRSNRRQTKVTMEYFIQDGQRRRTIKRKTAYGYPPIEYDDLPTSEESSR